MKLRNYQEKNSSKWAEILKKYKILALYMKVRTWKSITALETIKKYWAKKVLFMTKKKAISSIESDYKFFDKFFNIQIINY